MLIVFEVRNAMVSQFELRYTTGAIFTSSSEHL